MMKHGAHGGDTSGSEFGKVLSFEAVEHASHDVGGLETVHVGESGQSLAGPGRDAAVTEE